MGRGFHVLEIVILLALPSLKSWPAGQLSKELGEAVHTKHDLDLAPALKPSFESTCLEGV